MSWKVGTKVVLVRHPESFKTQEHKHGGPGLPLTERGQFDVQILAEYLKTNGLTSNAKLYGSSIVQVKETIELLHKAIQIPYEIDDKLKNIYMGVFDNKSDFEIAQAYPDAAHRLHLWRQGKLDVSEVNIPGAEDMMSFRARVNEALTQILSQDSEFSIAIFVVTRSVGVAITNKLLEETELTGMPYSRFKFHPASVSLIEITQPDGGTMLYHNRVEYLGRESEFPDD